MYAIEEVFLSHLVASDVDERPPDLVGVLGELHDVPLGGGGEDVLEHADHLVVRVHVVVDHHQAVVAELEFGWQIMNENCSVKKGRHLFSPRRDASTAATASSPSGRPAAPRT